MTHLATVQVDDEGNAATWGDHLTEEEYAAAPPIDSQMDPEPAGPPK
jgi:hypothetical protein